MDVVGVVHCIPNCRCLIRLAGKLRFQFSLKSLFLLVTVVAFAVGGYIVGTWWNQNDGVFGR